MSLLATVTATSGHPLASPEEPARSPTVRSCKTQRCPVANHNSCAKTTHSKDEAAGIKTIAVAIDVLKDAHKRDDFAAVVIRERETQTVFHFEIYI